VLAPSDPCKGDQLVLLTTRSGALRDEVAAHLLAEKVPELTAPRLLFEVADIAVLGTGKTDFITAQATARLGSTRSQCARQSARQIRGQRWPHHYDCSYGHLPRPQSRRYEGTKIVQHLKGQC
jgi:hypothetical protein